jgi:hypothetical protein
MHGAQNIRRTIRGTSSFRSLRGWAILHLFNELENIEVTRIPIREKTVDRILLILEDLKYRI